jgi:purine-binding chemotaxis protein CheW
MKKETQALLKSRAMNMALENNKIEETSGTSGIIGFTLGAEIYGIESEYVREVYPLKDFTTLPGVPSYILGIVNIRGQILPVIDLKKLFNLPEMGLGELNKLIILYNESMEFGILADEVSGTRYIDLTGLFPSPTADTGIGAKYLKGVTRDGLILLSAAEILLDKNIVVNDEAI